MTYRTYMRKKRSAGYMAAATFLLFVAMLLVYSCAAESDVPNVQGMTEDQILTKYADVIYKAANNRALAQVEAARRGEID